MASASNCKASDHIKSIHQEDSATPSDCKMADKRDLQLYIDSGALKKPIGAMITKDEFLSMWENDL